MNGICTKEGCKGEVRIVCQTGSTIRGFACDACGRIHDAHGAGVADEGTGKPLFWDSRHKKVYCWPDSPAAALAG